MNPDEDIDVAPEGDPVDLSNMTAVEFLENVADDLVRAGEDSFVGVKFLDSFGQVRQLVVCPVTPSLNAISGQTN